MAILRFMDSWVVGVNVCGKRPRRFVDPINMIRETIIRVHVRPFGVWISIICLIISLTSQCWKEWRRLLIRRFEDGNRIEGNIMMATTIIGRWKRLRRVQRGLGHKMGQMMSSEACDRWEQLLNFWAT